MRDLIVGIDFNSEWKTNQTNTAKKALNGPSPVRKYNGEFAVVRRQFFDDSDVGALLSAHGT